jgi:hypothetical protein
MPPWDCASLPADAHDIEIVMDPRSRHRRAIWKQHHNLSPLQVTDDPTLP